MGSDRDAFFLKRLPHRRRSRGDYKALAYRFQQLFVE
jgi:hypothetical protein